MFGCYSLYQPFCSYYYNNIWAGLDNWRALDFCPILRNLPSPELSRTVRRCGYQWVLSVLPPHFFFKKPTSLLAFQSLQSSPQLIINPVTPCRRRRLLPSLSSSLPFLVTSVLFLDYATVYTYDLSILPLYPQTMVIDSHRRQLPHKLVLELIRAGMAT